MKKVSASNTIVLYQWLYAMYMGTKFVKPLDLECIVENACACSF